MKIYTVTCFEKSRVCGVHTERRTWGWLPSFEAARDAVLANATDMFEGGYYDYAVIEEVPAGIISLGKAVGWFLAKVSDDHESLTVDTVQEPEWAQDVVNWSMG